MSDNNSTVAFLNRGTTKNIAALQWLKLVFHASVQHNFRFRAVHSPGVKNVVVDALSRLTWSAVYELRFFENFQGLFPGPHPNTAVCFASRITMLKSEFDELRLSAFTKSTERSRKRRQYFEFCRKHNRRALPATGHTVALFVAELARCLEYNTIKKSHFWNRLFALFPRS